MFYTEDENLVVEIHICLYSSNFFYIQDLFYRKTYLQFF